MTHTNLPPVYGKSFVGIWKRMFVSGRPEAQLRFTIFNSNGSCYGSLGPGSRIGGATVLEVNPEPNYPQKGTIKVKYNQRILIWAYTLNRNNGFKSEFRPVPGSNKQAPVLNELLLVGQGVRQLYAFFSHPFRPVITHKDIEAMEAV